MTDYLEITVRVKLNITKIVRMPEVINKFFTNFHKKLGVLEKINGLLFFRFDNCGHLERGHEANVSDAFLRKNKSALIRRFFVIKHLM